MQLEIGLMQELGQISFTVSLNPLAITDNYDSYDYMRTRHPHHAISCPCPQLLLISLIRKLFLWFQHNDTKELYDTNRIV